MSVRRELSQALRAVDDSLSASSPNSIPLADHIKINVIQRRIFEYAVLVVDHFRPNSLSPTSSSSSSPHLPPAPTDPPIFTHALSRTAYEAVAGKRYDHPLHPLLLGPIAALSFPIVSPQHLKAALSILSPQPPRFPAPLRRLNPGYYDPVAQAGLQKLLLLGARVEGKVFDVDETRWVGSIESGMEGLRAQLVGLLGSVGAGVTGVLESAGRSLYYTLEGRRGMLEEEGEGEKGDKEKDEKVSGTTDEEGGGKGDSSSSSSNSSST